MVDSGPTSTMMVASWVAPPAEVTVTSKEAVPWTALGVTVNSQLLPLWVTDISSVVSMLVAFEQVKL